jgi:hypothetical protein
VDIAPGHVTPCGSSGGTPATITTVIDDYTGVENTNTGTSHEHFAAGEQPMFWLKRGEYTHLIYNFIAAADKDEDDGAGKNDVDVDQRDDDVMNTDFGSPLLNLTTVASHPVSAHEFAETDTRGHAMFDEIEPSNKGQILFRENQ